MTQPVTYRGSVQVKLLRTAGQLPTVPTPSTLTPLDPGWEFATDILLGGLAWNTVDEVMYSRGDNGIVALGGSGGSGLQSQGDWNLTAGVLPNDPDIAAGWFWDVVLDDPNVPVVIGDQEINDGQTLRARIDNPQTIADFKIGNI